MGKSLQQQKERFLNLECIPEFKIKEVDSEFKEAYSQKAKKILDEMLSDPKVKGEIRKKILKCVKFLDLED